MRITKAATNPTFPESPDIVGEVMAMLRKNRVGEVSAEAFATWVTTTIEERSAALSLQSPLQSAFAKVCNDASDAGLPDEIRSFIEGMSVSVDVSTGDHDAGRRSFGTVTEVMDDLWDKHGVTLLVQDAKPNFTPPAAYPANQPAPTANHGKWTLTAPDGRQWTGATSLECTAAERSDRVQRAGTCIQCGGTGSGSLASGSEFCHACDGTGTGLTSQATQGIAAPLAKATQQDEHLSLEQQ